MFNMSCKITRGCILCCLRSQLFSASYIIIFHTRWHIIVMWKCEKQLLLVGDNPTTYHQHISIVINILINIWMFSTYPILSHINIVKMLNSAFGIVKCKILKCKMLEMMLNSAFGNVKCCRISKFDGMVLLNPLRGSKV